MNIKSANQTVLEASKQPTPRELWNHFWYEGEISCLFADSNVGKSILAVQIADSIAQRDCIYYLDFELSDKQFQLRYTNDNGEVYIFPDKLFRAVMDSSLLLEDNFEDRIISTIEQMASSTDCKIFIVDNITYLCSAMEKSDEAGRLMIRLKEIKTKYQLSILILAHTPKRSLNYPITQNDLAGSKRLFNFFDSVFAIGKSSKDGSIRYVKQLKVRNGALYYDSHNVIVYKIEKVNNFLKFVWTGYSTEKEHLKQIDDDSSLLREKIIELSRNGKSIRHIAKETGWSKTTIGRKLHEWDNDNSLQLPLSHEDKEMEQNGTVLDARQMDLFNQHQMEDKL